MCSDQTRVRNMQREERLRRGTQDADSRKMRKEDPQSKTRKIMPETSDKAKQLIHYQTVPDRRFPTERAYELIKQVVDERLETVEYGRACAVISQELSDCVKKCVKKCVRCDRYKLVCYVIIGQLKNTAVNCASRAVWSPAADTFTDYIYKNRSLFAVCILYAVYKE